MQNDAEKDEGPEWDSMVETVMDLIPAKLSHSEWRGLRDNIHTALWSYVGDIFDASSIEFRNRKDNPEIRLWMTIGRDCADFQKGFDITEILQKAYSRDALASLRDMLDARIAEMDREEGR